MNLEEARQHFIKYLEDFGRAPSTLIAYSKDIEQLVDFMQKKGISDVEKVSLGDLEVFMARFFEKGYTNKSVSRKTNSTKTFFGFLVERGFVKDNVSEYLKHPEVKATNPRILSRLEYRALRDVARNDPRTYALIEIFLQTGLSIAEIAGIQMEHLKMDPTLDKTNLYIPARGSKDERTIPLNEVAVSAIEAYKDSAQGNKKSPYLFITRTGNPMLVRNIRSTLNRYFKKAGVENVTVNDLRHTFIAEQLKSGVNLAYVSKIVGHKRVSTTERYLAYSGVEKSGQKTELVVL